MSVIKTNLDFKKYGLKENEASCCVTPLNPFPLALAKIKYYRKPEIAFLS